jgi:hypothetical protein
MAGVCFIRVSNAGISQVELRRFDRLSKLAGQLPQLIMKHTQIAGA